LLLSFVGGFQTAASALTWPDGCHSFAYTFTAYGNAPHVVTSGMTDVTPTSCWIIDASAGSVVIEFPPKLPLVLDGGSIETINTSPEHTVTLEAIPVDGNAQKWVGVRSVNIVKDGEPVDAPEVILTDTTMVRAGASIFTGAFKAERDHFGGPLCVLAGPGDLSTAGTIDRSTVTTSSGCNVATDPEVHPAVAIRGFWPLTVTHTTVRARGQHVGGLQAQTVVATFPPSQGGGPDLQVNHDEVEGVAENEPAVVLEGATDLGQAGNFVAVTGRNDTQPVVAFSGQSLTGFVWPITPASETEAPQQLGLEGYLQVVAGDVTVRPNTTVAAVVQVLNGAINAPVGPTYFTGVRYFDTDLWSCTLDCFAYVRAQSADLSGATVLGSMELLGGGVATRSRIAHSYIGGELTSSIPLTITSSVLADGVDVQSLSPGLPTTVTASRLIHGSQSGFTDPATMTCDVVDNDFALTLAGGSAISESDVTASSQPALASSATDVGSVVASLNWWGQPGGPTAGQVTGAAVSAPALEEPSTCADQDPTPAAPVAYLRAHAREGSIKLDWVAPRDPGFTGVVVRMAPGTVAPSGPGAGALVYRGHAHSVRVKDLEAGAPYAFSVFSISSDAVTRGLTTVSTVAR
jgi:hypothetical protein